MKSLSIGDVIWEPERMPLLIAGPCVLEDGDEAMKIARSIALNDRVGVELTKRAINRSFEIMGMRQALLQGLELGISVEASETPESKRFNEILEKEGAKAALAWQEARLGGAS